MLPPRAPTKRLCVCAKQTHTLEYPQKNRCRFLNIHLKTLGVIGWYTNQELHQHRRCLCNFILFSQPFLSLVAAFRALLKSAWRSRGRHDETHRATHKTKDWALQWGSNAQYIYRERDRAFKSCGVLSKDCTHSSKDCDFLKTAIRDDSVFSGTQARTKSISVCICRRIAQKDSTPFSQVAMCLSVDPQHQSTIYYPMPSTVCFYITKPGCSIWARHADPIHKRTQVFEYIFYTFRKMFFYIYGSCIILALLATRNMSMAQGTPGEAFGRSQQ